MVGNYVTVDTAVGKFDGVFGDPLGIPKVGDEVTVRDAEALSTRVVGEGAEELRVFLAALEEVIGGGQAVGRAGRAPVAVEAGLHQLGAAVEVEHQIVAALRSAVAARILLTVRVIKEALNEFNSTGTSGFAVVTDAKGVGQLEQRGIFDARNNTSTFGSAYMAWGSGQLVPVDYSAYWDTNKTGPVTTFSNNNRTLSNPQFQQATRTLSTTGKSAGKFYFEVALGNISGNQYPDIGISKNDVAFTAANAQRVGECPRHHHLVLDQQNGLTRAAFERLFGDKLRLGFERLVRGRKENGEGGAAARFALHFNQPAVLLDDAVDGRVQRLGTIGVGRQRLVHRAEPVGLVVDDVEARTVRRRHPPSSRSAAGKSAERFQRSTRSAGARPPGRR